ncbi:MAG: insulinase family protein [Planctomycetes bacterium]|nr:insulinase family protein [Planctomycetota bacterium]
MLGRRRRLPVLLRCLLAWAAVAATVAGALVALPAPADAQQEREYRALTLENGLKVFLVHDPGAGFSGVGLAVNAGSMYDGDTPGIAHFLEHMLFLGTHKYPEPGAYTDYLTAHDGRYNAYTGFELTNFHFEVKSEALEGALDRFAQFFVAPLLTDELSGRERNAVDSEHSKNLEDDTWRARQVYRSLLNPAHPDCHFSTGNKETLAGIRNEQLRAFYDAHYSANLMNLAIISDHPSDTLEKWAREKFGPVANKNCPKPAVSVPLFHPAIAGQLIEVRSVRELRRLGLRFELKDEDFDYESKPTRLVSAILGHEGPESLLDKLKREGLATSLMAGSDALANQGTFNLDLDLTEEGLARVDVVLERIFGMINYVRGLAELPGYLAEEERQMAELELRFHEPGRVFDEARTLAALMVRFPHEHLLENARLIRRNDPAAVRHLLAALVPQNAVVVLTAKDRQGDRLEPHYGASYAVRALPPEWVARLQHATRVPPMDLPAPNDFIPTRFDLIEPRVAASPGLHAFELGEVWLRHDVRFKRPKAALHFRILNGRNHLSAREYALGELFAAAAGEALNPFRYPMTQAGIALGVSSTLFGLELSAQGYSDKLPELVAFAAPYLTEVRMDELQFGILRERFVRELENHTKQPPSRLAVEFLEEALRETTFTAEQRLTEARTLSLADLKAYVLRLREGAWLQGCVYGNLTTGTVERMAEEFMRSLGPKRALPEAERFHARVLDVPKGTSLVLKRAVDSNDSAALLVYLGDPATLEAKAMLHVLKQLLHNRFFQDLRTLQQTGYLVSAGVMDFEGVPAVFFLSQSSVVDPPSLLGRFEAFVKHLLPDLRATPPETFESARKTAATELLRLPKDFREAADWHFLMAFHFDGDFDTNRKTAIAARAMTRERWLELLAAYLVEDGARRLAFEMEGSAKRFSFQESTLEGLRKGAKGFRQRFEPAEAEGGR